MSMPQVTRLPRPAPTPCRPRGRWPCCSPGCRSARATGSRSPPQGQDTSDLYDFVFVIAVVIFFLVEGLIVYAALPLPPQARPTTELPPQIHGNNVLEIVWTVIPTVIVVVLFVFSWQTLNNVDAVSATAGRCTSAPSRPQFQWSSSTSRPDGQTVLFTQQAPELDLPVGVDRPRDPALSKDVIHAFYVPQFLFKRDVVPGRENKFDFTIDPLDVEPDVPRPVRRAVRHVPRRDAVHRQGAAARPTSRLARSSRSRPRPRRRRRRPVGARGQRRAGRRRRVRRRAAGPTLDLTAHNIAFTRPRSRRPAEPAVHDQVHNNDPGVTHNVAITDGTGQRGLQGRDLQRPRQPPYPIPALPAGTYTFACSVHPHDDRHAHGPVRSIDGDHHAARTPSGYRSGLYEWLTTTDHKKIGILYLVNSILIFLIGGMLALGVRVELAQPGHPVPDQTPVQPGVHDPRLADALPVRHPGPGRLRQLHRAADDRRARTWRSRGSTPSRSGCCRSAAILMLVGLRRPAAAPRLPAGPSTARWRRRSTRASGPTCGSWPCS